ncbi:MAG: hypothetical protein ACW99G_24245 [Candidatus Thorarchaeota archaeon]|jgi:hypothetical protein
MIIECPDCGHEINLNISLYGAQEPSIITVLEWIIKELKEIEQ